MRALTRISAAMIHRGDQHLAGACVETGDQRLGPTPNRRRQLGPVRCEVGVAAHDRHAVGRAGLAQALQDRGRLLGIARPERVGQRRRPPAHGGDIRDIDHRRAPPGEPGRAGDQFIHKAFGGHKLPARPIGPGRRVVAGPAGAVPGQAKPRAGHADRALARDVGMRGEACREVGQSAHAAERVSDTQPCAGLATGG